MCLGAAAPGLADSGAPEDSRSLNGEWIRHGGARLYWNTLMYPKQIRMGGTSFRDPGSVPELLAPPKSVKPARKRNAAKKAAPAQVQAAAAPAAGTTVPKPEQISPALTVTQPSPSAADVPSPQASQQQAPPLQQPAQVATTASDSVPMPPMPVPR